MAHGRAERWLHPVLEQEFPHHYIDTCMQAWPDADWASAHRHGVSAYCVTAWIPHATIDQAIEGAMSWHLVARQHPNMVVATTAEAIRRAKREGRASLVITAQDGDWIGHKLHRIEALYRLGLRMMLPAYNRSNQICAGCLDRNDGGLSRFGELVVDECNRLGLLLDGSHLGKRSSLELIDRSRLPCVFSHSSARALVDNPRNIDDEQIKACAARGGVIGLCTWGPLILPEGHTGPVTLDHFIDHVDHVAQLTGSTDHIGISTDMSLGSYPDLAGWPDAWDRQPEYPNVLAAYDERVYLGPLSPRHFPTGFTNYAEVVNVPDALKRRGYTDEDVRKLLGENFLRVFAQVWGE